jgi:hypothetical protein
MSLVASDEPGSLFSLRDLYDSIFQNTIIEFLCLGMPFFNLIKENHGLHEDDVIAEHLIPSRFNAEAYFLSNSNLNSLKCHYMTFN